MKATGGRIINTFNAFTKSIYSNQESIALGISRWQINDVFSTYTLKYPITEDKLQSFDFTDGVYTKVTKSNYGYSHEYIFVKSDILPTKLKIDTYYKSAGGAGIVLRGDILEYKNVSFAMSVIDFCDFVKTHDVKSGFIEGKFKVTKKGSSWFIVEDKP